MYLSFRTVAPEACLYRQPVCLDCRQVLYVPTIRTVTVSSPYHDTLIDRCKEGDRVAFAELFRKHRSDVYRLVHRMLGPTPDCEDVVQEVFLQVFHSIKDFEGRASFNTWLHRVAINCALMHRRSQKSRPVLVSESLASSESTTLRPDEGAIGRERARAFYALLDRLPEKKRTVFVLHELDGLPLKDIAKLTHTQGLTVRTRLFYARRDLVRLLREDPTLASLAHDTERDTDPDLQPPTEVDQ